MAIITLTDLAGATDTVTTQYPESDIRVCIMIGPDVAISRTHVKMLKHSSHGAHQESVLVSQSGYGLPCLVDNSGHIEYRCS